MYHDYRIFNPSRGFLCLNELDLGVPLKPAMSSIFRQKLTPQVYKVMVLEAKRFSAKEALEGGIVDVLGGMDECLVLVKERKLAEKPKMGVYAPLRMEMFRETLGYVTPAGFEREEKRSAAILDEEDAKKEEAKERVQKWESSGAAKAKL